MAGILALAALAVSSGLMMDVQGAAAVEVHAFDPYLSLTGNCTTSAKDPVPDPGCPDGPLPPQPLEGPVGLATDSYGDIYVSSSPNAQAIGRVDVFSPEGLFITEIAGIERPRALAVDSQGNLYVVSVQPGESGDGGKLLRYAPSPYEPAFGQIAYPDPAVVAIEHLSSVAATGLALNPLNDHVFVHSGALITEYGSAGEETKVLDATIGAGTLSSGFPNLAVDAAHNRIYASSETSTAKPVINVYDLTTHELLMVVSGSSTPAGSFKGSWLAVAADEGTGHFFVFDGGVANVVYEFDESGGLVETIEHQIRYVPEEQIAVDNGTESRNGALSSGRYLYVPSDPGGLGHLYAFGPSTVCAPQIEAVSAGEITETEAFLTASIESCGAATTYVFQYTSQERFENEGFAGAQTAGQGTLPAAQTPQSVSSALVGLSPDSSYRYRVVATNSVDSASAEGSFTTYPVVDLGTCPNAALRTGFSVLLPDCRAYELVTPPDTNARAPKGVDHLGVYFATREASPAGDKLSFRIEGGTLPAYPGTGGYAGDPYLSTRGAGGWTTALTGPVGAETNGPLPGSTSPDQGYSFWSASGVGSAMIPGNEYTKYVRYPDGHSELVGRGSLGVDPQGSGKLISENGGHIIFVTGAIVNGQAFGKGAVQLEPNAPPSDTAAIYDRTADGVTHVVSLLPGDKTPEPGEHASYLGVSLDGRGVAFTIGGSLYLRQDNSATFDIGSGIAFAGVAEGGARIFYVQGKNLKAFDADSGKTISFTTSGDITLVNVAPQGGAAYFVSPSVLTGKATNPVGAKPKAGQNNLYLSRAGALTFVGTMTERDVVGREIGGVESVEGLGLWISAVGGETASGDAGGRFGIDPSRSTPDGNDLIFESRAHLTAYDPEGNVEIYLFNQEQNSLRCLSCNPTGTAPTGGASLQSISKSKEDPVPLSSYAAIGNLRADGRRAFFQSTEALVPTDTDGLQDVYEWEEQGVGSCTRIAGCLNLISSGGSPGTDYLYAVSDSGDDVFFSTSDLLLAADTESTPSIYDARVGGGFPEAARRECQGEGCHPSLSSPPALLAPGAESNAKSGNVPKRCPKGKRRVKRHGKVRCVKKKHQHGKHTHHRAGAKKKGAGR